MSFESSISTELKRICGEFNRLTGCVRGFAHRPETAIPTLMNSVTYKSTPLARHVLNVRATFWEEG
jgi:hypothetical protein